MKLILRPILAFILLLNISIASHAQENFWEMRNLSNLNVDQLSDQQVTSFYSYVIQSKMTEADFINMASQKGLSPLQLGRLKERMIRLRNEGQTIPPVNKGDNGNMVNGDLLDQRFNQDLFYTPITTQEEIDSTIYGAELFSKSSSVFEPNLRIATPSSYIIGPDDELIISVYGQIGRAHV